MLRLRTAVIPWLLCAVLLAACAVPPGATPTVGPTEPPSATPMPSPTTPASPEPPTETPGPSPEGLPTPGEYAPQPGDDEARRGNIFIEDYGVKPSPGDPAQLLLSLSGNRPSPCSALRVVVDEPDAANLIAVEVYTMRPADRVCADVLSPFAAEVPLGTLPPGEYTVVINDELKVTFTV